MSFKSILGNHAKKADDDDSKDVVKTRSARQKVSKIIAVRKKGLISETKKLRSGTTQQKASTLAVVSKSVKNHKPNLNV